MSLQDSLADLEKAVGQLKTTFDNVSGTGVSVSPQFDQAMGELRGELARVEAAVGTGEEALQVLAERVIGSTLPSELRQRIDDALSDVSERINAADGDFAELADDLARLVSDELKGWMEEGLERLGEALGGAVNQVKEHVSGAAQRFGEEMKEAVVALGDGVHDRVEERCREAGREIVEAAVDRALTEVAETLVTTEIGVAVTSAIGPYLPVVIALKPALPAIQEALDVMRGGL